MSITASTVNGTLFADHKLTTPEIAEAVAWLEQHGFGSDRLVLQVQYEVCDCPLVRVWWLTHDEIKAIPTEQLYAVEGDLTQLAHVDEVACRSLPSWWQPA